MKCKTCGHNLSEHYDKGDECVFIDDTVGSDHEICKCEGFTK